MSSAPIPHDLIEKSHAARLLGVHYTTVHHMVLRGELTGFRVTRGSTKVSEAEVRAHVEVSPASVDFHIRRIADAPSLSGEQIEKLRSLLAPST